jgi:chromosome segregation ATPase
LLRQANEYLKDKEIIKSEMKCLQERINCLQEKHDMLQADTMRLNCLLDEHGMLVNNDLVKSMHHVLTEIHAKNIENTMLNTKVRQISEKLTNAERVNFENRSRIDQSNEEIRKLKCECDNKTLEIADCKNAIESLRWDTLNAKQKMETELKEEIRSLKKDLTDRSLELDITRNRLKAFEDSEKMLLESKDRFCDEIQSLKDSIIAMQEEKMQLVELVEKLRGNCCNVSIYFF